MLCTIAALVLLLQSTAPEGGQPTSQPPAAPAGSEKPTPPPESVPELPTDNGSTEVPPGEPQGETPAAEPTAAPDSPQSPDEVAIEAEKPTRAWVIVDRVSTAAGIIESEDDLVIVLRDERGRVRSLTKNRVLGVKYLLDGPPGRRVRVVFNDGRVIVAKLVEDGYEHLSVEIEGITTRFPREAVDEVLPYPTDEELYRRFRETVEPDQFGARYTLALWLFRKRMYEDSERELESLLEVTNHYEAKRLLVEVKAQLKLSAPRDPSTARTRPDGDRDRRREQDRAAKSSLLSAADVNLIRVYELDLTDPPRMQVSQELIKAMLERYAENELIPAKASERNALYSKTPVEIVRMLFALKARDLYGDIKVLSEPKSLDLFRQRVHNAWMIANCATSRCHGGPDAGRFFLHNNDWKDPIVRTTNMLIVTRTTLDTLPVIDFEKPTDSLLFQYALPKTEARRPHPDVKGWEPVFTKSRGELKGDFVDWVRSMRVPRGEYPSIEFEPPGLKRPATPIPGGPDR